MLGKVHIAIISNLIIKRPDLFSELLNGRLRIKLLQPLVVNDKLVIIEAWDIRSSPYAVGIFVELADEQLFLVLKGMEVTICLVVVSTSG